jgi:hypothetical protein
MHNATTHIGTSIDPANCKCVMFPSQVGFVRRLKAEMMVVGGNGGSGSNQAPHMPTRNHQANTGMGL